MASIIDNVFGRLGFIRENQAFNINQSNNVMPMMFNGMAGIDKPAWVSLSCAAHLELAARKNPIVKSCINILARSAANARKVAVDINTGEIIPWTDKRPAIQKAYSLITERPNPTESAKEFETLGITYLKTFGNRYVRVVMPIGFDSEIDLMNVDALWNLPSQHVQVKTTGKIYNQTTIEGIISEYALTRGMVIEKYTPNEIIQFNEVNISSEFPSIMGISALESLKEPIESTMMAMLAGANLLKNGGFQGIASPAKKDGQGGNVIITEPEQKAMDKKIKEHYGNFENQARIWFPPVPIDFEKTAFTATELGIYDAISNGALLISNVLGVPYELVKADLKGTTYENQDQSVKRLYQDTTIPDVEDWDKYWSWRLQTSKYGFRIESRWDHIQALADGFKDKAIALNQNTKSADTSWNNNTITINQYLDLTEQKALIGSDGDMYKFQWEAKHGINQPVVNTNNN